MIEPYKTGMLDVGDGHAVYWECRGNPSGTPAIYLHGGPGSGCSAGSRGLFDPRHFNAVLWTSAAAAVAPRMSEMTRRS